MAAWSRRGRGWGEEGVEGVEGVGVRGGKGIKEKKVVGEVHLPSHSSEEKRAH
jgi:hypothetical protein